MQSSAEGVESPTETETKAHTYWRRETGEIDMREEETHTHIHTRRETGEIDMRESKRHTLTFVLEERQET